jgi:hypothetical protein
MIFSDVHVHFIMLVLDGVKHLVNPAWHWSYILSGFVVAGSKFLSIVRRARMVSSGDNGVYTGSGLRGVIPYVQCVAAVFLSQVCS